MNLPHELHDLCNKGFVTLGPAGRIVRFSTAKMMDRPVKGMIREGVEALFYTALIDDEDDVQNTVREFKEVVKGLRGLDVSSDVIAFEDQSDWPAGDGDGYFMPITIGVRGQLTKREARYCAAMWREATRRYPKAHLQINLLGYNEDPREIWNIPEAARYVRWWARFAGMDDPETVERYLLNAPDVQLAVFGNQTIAGVNIGFLASCGVYGDEMKAHVLRNHEPPVRAS